MIFRLSTLAATVVADVAVFAYASFDQLNVIFNIATIIVAVAVAFPIIRSKRKDATISELLQVVDSKNLLLEAHAADIEGLKKRAASAEEKCHEAQIKAEHWEARYREQENYTAKGALEQVAERLGGLEGVLRAAFDSHGELILKNGELLAKLDERLPKSIEGKV